nr:HNH endonuclease domain-containing protein [Lunatimonas sp.]
MLANAWYPINYYKLSFGKQDKIQEAISFFHKQRGIPIDLTRHEVWESILTCKDTASISCLLHFDNQVPHWFISPWFPSKYKKKQIYVHSKNPAINSPYFLQRDYVEVNPAWQEYLTKNSAILKDFCFWNLSLFLQKHNPNVPDIPNKLIKPIRRGSLENHKKGYWNLYFDEVKEQRCIYSGNLLTKRDYSLDHFVPYNFVSHDLNWNLVPAHRSVNSSKSDKLPRLTQFFDVFFEIQRKSFEIVFRKAPRSKYIEQYLSIFPSIDGLLIEKTGKARLKETLEPLITIAHNNGFEIYEPKR